MKKWIVLIIMVVFCGVCEASDVPISWKVATGVTGYKIYMSTDLGVTWLAPKDVGNVLTYTYVGVADDKLILFRISTYNASGAEAITQWAGAWFDGRKKPPQFASSLGIP